MFLQAKRMYWVGLPNHWGRLRYKYYKRRGWIRGEYFVKPASKTVEWLHCLISPKHAKTTWLEVDSDTERKALTIALVVVVGLFATSCFVWGMAYGKLQAVEYFKTSQQTNRIQLQPDERVI